MSEIQIGNLRRYQVVLIIIVFSILIVVMSLVLPPAVDWRNAFRPAALKFLSGHSPYDVTGYNNPPWALFVLSPVALLPETIGRAVLLLVGLISFAYTAQKLGAKPIGIFFLLLSPPVLHCLLNGNIDWLAVLGFVVPPWIGLFFITIKPQIGVAYSFKAKLSCPLR